MRKNILITGCSSGIGYHAAKSLNSRGWDVFATCRQEEDCQKLRDEGLSCFLLDYKRDDTILSTLDKIDELAGGKLDAVFNNGAYALPGFLEDLSRDALREIFEVNVFGHIELIRQAMPLLTASSNPRVINCSSVLGFAALPYRGAYNATKFAIEGFTDTMRRENSSKNIKYILIEPGPIATNIRKNSIPPFEKWVHWQQSKHKTVYEKKIIPILYGKDLKKSYFELTPEHVTKKLIHALESRKPRIRYYVTSPTYFASAIMRFTPACLQDYFFTRYE